MNDPNLQKHIHTHTLHIHTHSLTHIHILTHTHHTHLSQKVVPVDVQVAVHGQTRHDDGGDDDEEDQYEDCNGAAGRSAVGGRLWLQRAAQGLECVRLHIDNARPREVALQQLAAGEGGPDGARGKLDRVGHVRRPGHSVVRVHRERLARAQLKAVRVTKSGKGQLPVTLGPQHEEAGASEHAAEDGTLHLRAHRHGAACAEEGARLQQHGAARRQVHHNDVAGCRCRQQHLSGRPFGHHLLHEEALAGEDLALERGEEAALEHAAHAHVDGAAEERVALSLDGLILVQANLQRRLANDLQQHGLVCLVMCCVCCVQQRWFGAAISYVASKAKVLIATNQNPWQPSFPVSFFLPVPCGSR
eukprot:m.52530 g.52530  ORF g.52530 m.52530 type:complete len:360 (-) comp13081_c0_seq1:31-1110(-)